MADEPQVDFRELLRTTTSDNVERRAALPKGHYHGIVMNHEFGRSTRKGTAFVQFNLKFDGPGPDVDLTKVEGVDWTNRTGKITRYITPKAMAMLTDTLDAVLGRDGRVCDERIPEMDGQKVLIETEPQVDDKGNETGFDDITAIVKDK